MPIIIIKYDHADVINTTESHNPIKANRYWTKNEQHFFITVPILVYCHMYKAYSHVTQ